ncbi:MAG TPA: hypothetical protein VHC21_00025 [Candidatus Saccharimonadales bacterium]|nr:hypothetical protein [Candidatus Saccharimonadales bacterium]
MSELLGSSEQDRSESQVINAARQVGKITVLEALAENSTEVGPSMSNVSTPPQGDLDDQ